MLVVVASLEAADHDHDDVLLSVFVAERRREEILDVLKRCYYIKKQKNVPFFYATSKNLCEFTTTEKDMKN